MDTNYYKTVVLFVNSFIKTNTVNIEKLKSIINGCPAHIKDAILNNKFVLEYDPKNLQKYPVYSRPITTMIFGICYFLAKSNWKLSETLIPALLTFVNSKFVPAQASADFIGNNKDESEIQINEVLWCDFTIIPATLFSFAHTLAPSDPLLFSITESVYSLWIRVAKRIIKYLGKSRIDALDNKNIKDTNNDKKGTPSYMFWYGMFFSHLSFGTNLCLSSENLANFILNPEKIQDINRISLPLNTEIPDSILKIMHEFLNDDKCRYLNGVHFYIKTNPMGIHHNVSLTSFLLHGIASFAYRIGKIEKVNQEPNLLGRYHQLISKLYEKFLNHTETFASYNNTSTKVTDLKTIINTEKYYLTQEETIFQSCLLNIVEMKILIVDPKDYPAVEKLTQHFFDQFNSNKNCIWPISLGEIFIKESSIYGLSIIIKMFPDYVEKLRVIPNLIDILTKPAEIFTVIGTNSDYQIIKSFANTLAPFSFKYCKNEESLREIPSMFVYYFYFKQKFIHSILDCLKSAISQRLKQYPEVILECISSFNHELFDWHKRTSIEYASAHLENTFYDKVSLSVQALGFLGIEFSYLEGIYDSVLSSLHQKFMNPVSGIDLHVANQLTALLLSNTNAKNYSGIMDSFKKIITINTRETAIENSMNEIILKYPCQAIVNLLHVISFYINGEELMLRYLQDLISIYIQFCITLRKSPKQTLNAQYLITFMSEFIKSISCVIDRIGPIVSNNGKVQQLFKNFWVYLVIMGSTNSGPFSPELLIHYKKISKCSPPLVVDHLRSDLEYNVSIKDDIFDILELSETRNLLIDCLECSQIDIKSIILRLPALHVIFLLAIFEQESLAVEYDSNRFPHLFLYLEDKSLGKDKQNIGTLIEYTCDMIFGKFIESLKKRHHGIELDSSLTSHIKLLLVHFNSEVKRVQRNADKYLSILINNFPHMLWSPNVVLMMLDFVHILKITCNEMNSQCESCCIDVPRTNMKFIIPDTKEKRDRLIIDYQSRCESLINEASKWAPNIICSILLEYLVDNRLSFKDIPIHYGIELLMNSIISVENEDNYISQEIEETASTNTSNPSNTKPDVNNYPYSGNNKFKNKKRESSKEQIFSTSKGFVSACTFTATLRSHYIGKMEGILYMKNMKSTNKNDCCYYEIEEYLLTKLKNYSKLTDSEITDSVLLVTAFICITKRFNRKIIHQLCYLPVNINTAEYMKLAIECWEWIFTSCREYQLSLIYSIWSAWESTMYKSIGLFKFTYFESAQYTATSDPSIIHDMWIKYLIQRFDVIKFYHYEKVKVISLIVIESLKFILSHEVTFNYFEANSLCFLRLICLGLKLVQNTYQSNNLCRSILREKIFRSLLLYFSTELIWPLPKKTSELLEIFSNLYKLLLGDRKWNNEEENIESVSTQSFRTLKPSNKTLTSVKYHSDKKDSSKSFLTIGTRRGKGHVALSSKNGSSITLEGTSLTTYLSNNLSVGSENSFYAFGITTLQVEDINLLRNILLYLINREINRLFTWLNPIDRNEPNNINPKAFKSSFNDKLYNQKINLLWQLNQKVVIYLPQRIFDIPNISKDIYSLIRSNPSKLIDEPNAASIFWCSVQEFSNLSSHIQSILIFWANSKLSKALEFVCHHLCQPNTIATQYTVFCLKSSYIDDVLFYIPQLVQSLRNDTYGYLEEYILWISQRTKIISHQFIWNMHTNIYLDDDCTSVEPVVGPKLAAIVNSIKNNFDQAGLLFYNREFNFFKQLTNISAILKPIEKSKRKPVCQEELAKIVASIGVYLPTNPDSLIKNIDYTSGIPMQSAAKAPFLASFEVYQVTTKFIEDINALSDVKIPELMNNSNILMKKGAIFKVGDDVRQDVLALQIISLFKNIFDKLGLKLFLFPYKVVATAPGCGVIECVPNAKSRDQLGKHTDVSLHKYFLHTFGGEQSDAYKIARENFASSLSAYSIVSYILQLKDRHNGNIMINSEGYLIHIDFGFLFESSPGGNMGFEPDMKITSEMLKILGGSVDAPYFKSFVEKSIKGYLAIRPYQEDIVNTVALMLDTGLPCFRGETLKRLRSRFSPNITEREASQIFEKLIYDSCLNYRTRLYDLIQLAQNEIPC